jgi:hypothetical protein
MATALILKLMHAVNNKVTGVGDKLKGVDDNLDVIIKRKLTCCLLLAPPRMSARPPVRREVCEGNPE